VDEHTWCLLAALLGVSAEALRLVRVVFRSQASLVAENLFLRKHLTLLIAVMVQESPTPGEARIAAELALKLGVRLSPRTVRAYWPRELRPNRTHKRPPKGDISLTILLVGLTGKRVQFVSVNQAGCSSKDSGSFASSSKSAAYGKSTPSNASGFVPRHPGCTKRSLVKQHLGEGASYA